MKHIKIFEEFNKTPKSNTVIKYECIKPLPTHRIVSKSRPSSEDKNTHDTYFIDVDDPEKIASIEAELRKQGYDLNYSPPKEIKCIRWYSDTKKGQDMRVNVFNHVSGTMVPSSVQIPVNFDEHFKLKHEYRGHNLKKFGI